MLLKDFKFYANGIEISLNKMQGDEYRGIFEEIIKQDVVDTNPSYTRLMFRVKRTFSPQELVPDSPDSRQLSLAVHSIIVEPVSSMNKDKEKNVSKNFQKFISFLLRH